MNSDFEVGLRKNKLRRYFTNNMILCTRILDIIYKSMEDLLRKDVWEVQLWVDDYLQKKLKDTYSGVRGDALNIYLQRSSQTVWHLVLQEARGV